MHWDQVSPFGSEIVGLSSGWSVRTPKTWHTSYFFLEIIFLHCNVQVNHEWWCSNYVLSFRVRSSSDLKPETKRPVVTFLFTAASVVVFLSLLFCVSVCLSRLRSLKMLEFHPSPLFALSPFCLTNVSITNKRVITKTNKKNRIISSSWISATSMCAADPLAFSPDACGRVRRR